MNEKLKKLFNKILPASKSQIYSTTQEISEEIERTRHDLKKTEATYCEELRKSITEIIRNQEYNRELEQVLETQLKDTKETIITVEKKINEIKERIESIEEKVENIEEKECRIEGNTNEAVWGMVFNSSIENSEWLKDKAFYPGRWAVGYQYLYVLYRVLNTIMPKCILELGLGQSTKMISQYVNTYNGVIHKIAEHDTKWVDFYKQEFSLSQKSEIIIMNLDEIQYLSEPEVTVYKEFDEKLAGFKYDFISIDGPFGGNEQKYSRIDILQIVPECLADSYVIMIDDAHRIGEKNTIGLIQKKLRENDLKFWCGNYSGKKDTYVIASMDNRFICTL